MKNTNSNQNQNINRDSTFTPDDEQDYTPTVNTIRERVLSSEEKGRNYFRNIAPRVFKDLKKITQSLKISDKYDCIVTAKQEYIVEIKVRNMKSTRYADYMMEESKYKYLMERAKEGYVPLYVNFFEDGLCLIWDLTEEAEFLNAKTMLANRTTVNLGAGKVDKKCLMLLRDRAKFVRYDV